MRLCCAFARPCSIPPAEKCPDRSRFSVALSGPRRGFSAAQGFLIMSIPSSFFSASGGSALANTLAVISNIILVLFTVCYLYQYFYIPVALFGKRAVKKAARRHSFAVLVCARNEEAVIAGCIDSIISQAYPKELLRVFVLADNCTDGTAEAARSAGAIVYERKDERRIGKGYALEYLFSRIAEDYPRAADAYIIFDADNIVDSGFVAAMNDMYEAGYNVSTCYRNTKNYTDSVIAACSGLWFLRESRFLNGARMLLGTGCAVSGTGFMISRKYLESIGGWNCHILIEDIEFTVECALRGEKIGYCRQAITYDEQPVDFKTAWHQRIRWCKGYFQLFTKYSLRLLKGALKGSFTCFDMLMNLSPAYIISIFGQLTFAAGLIISFFTGAADIISVLLSVCKLLLGGYVTMFILGAITTASEWKSIYAKAPWKLLIVLLFPLFIATYLPISLIALFSKPQWKHIEHTSRKTRSDFKSKSDAA